MWKSKSCPPIEFSVPFLVKVYFSGGCLIASMTGYGRAEVNQKGITVSSEVRSVNSRYLDLTLRLPRNFAQREKDVKEIIRGYLNRGSLNITVKVLHDSNGDVPLKVNKAAAQTYFKLLNEVRKAIKLKEKVKLEHLLTFSEIFEPIEESESDEFEWDLVQLAIKQALENLNKMRSQEGQELVKDLEKRILLMDELLNKIEQLSKERIPEERKNLQDRISQLVEDKFVIDQNRLELEIALIVDKLDVTEECVRFRSHNKFFLEAMQKEESAGRKLNFLIQEMNREANTIGSKSSDAAISHLVVGLKEELEKIREQLQNIE
jgi:uncharacterized protein (TIGR00255 family)